MLSSPFMFKKTLSVEKTMHCTSSTVMLCEIVSQKENDAPQML